MSRRSRKAGAATDGGGASSAALAASPAAASRGPAEYDDLAAPESARDPQDLGRFDPLMRPPRLPAPDGAGPRGAEPTVSGAAASGMFHLTLIGLAVFGTQIFGEPEPVQLVFENVTMIEAPEFDAAISQQPDVGMTEAASLSQPVPMFQDDADVAGTDISEVVQTEEYIYGDVADAEEFPDLTAVLTPLQRAKVRPPKVASLAPASPGLGASGPGLSPMGMGGAAPGMRAPGGPARAGMGGMSMARSSMSIDTSSDEGPPPPPPERQADEAQPDTDAVARADAAQEAASIDGAKDAPAQEESQRDAAPEAAADRRLTEADETDADSETLSETASAGDPDAPDDIDSLPEAPRMARLPVGRPADLEQARREAAEEEAARLAAEDAAEKAAEAEAARLAAEQEAAEKAAAEKLAAEKAAADKAAAEKLAAEKRAAAKAAAESAARQASAGNGDAPLGAPLTTGETSGLRNAISKKWNTSMLERLPDYRNLVVTMRIRLDQAGKIVGTPELVSPSSASGPVAVAVQAAERALLGAQPYQLPAGKYGRWKEIEVTFNPGSGVSM